jgi:hypothetical protein
MHKEEHWNEMAPNIYSLREGEKGKKKQKKEKKG